MRGKRAPGEAGGAGALALTGEELRLVRAATSRAMSQATARVISQAMSRATPPVARRHQAASRAARSALVDATLSRT